MNSIPLTFRERQISRTVIGGRLETSENALNCCAILLNSSGSHLRIQVLENLVSCGFKTIISVEPRAENFNIEDMSRRFPSVKFLVPLEKCSDGDLINMCVSETDAKWIFVLRDGLNISANCMTKNLLENMTKTDEFAFVPRFVDYNGNGLPVNIVPEANRNRFCLSPNLVIGDEIPTVTFYNFMGLFNREKFILLGGYDYTITNPYWQCVDFGIRAWLWGEKIKVSTKMSLQYVVENEIPDSTPDLSYLRFYLKNLLPKFKIDHGEISWFSFIKFFVRSRCGIFEALKQFDDAKKWVDKTKFRFKFDIQYLIENWSSLR